MHARVLSVHVWIGLAVELDSPPPEAIKDDAHELRQRQWRVVIYQRVLGRLYQAAANIQDQAVDTPVRSFEYIVARPQLSHDDPVPGIQIVVLDGAFLD